MRTMHSIVTLACGMAAGVAFTLSCGDDNPNKVDASDAPMCDCPAAETPIKPRIMEYKKDYTIPANTPRFGGSVACTGISYSAVLNGGCIANDNDNIVLRASAPSLLAASGFGWDCLWSNPSGVDVTVTAVVHCLASPQ